jgi:hypothetical protein
MSIVNNGVLRDLDLSISDLYVVADCFETSIYISFLDYSKSIRVLLGIVDYAIKSKSWAV